MTEARGTDQPGSPPPWPRVVGTVGIVVAVIMFLDQLGDLLVPLVMNEGFWRRFLAPDLAEFVARAMPGPGWLVLTSLIGMALAVLLFVGSLRLRRRLRSGVRLCRTWAWIAIAWVAIEIGRAFWWMAEYGDELAGLAGTGWEGSTVLGLLLALAILLAYPVFLLVWLARPPVRTECLTWQA